MKKISLSLFVSLFLFLSCYNNDTIVTEANQHTEIRKGTLIKTVNLATVGSEFDYEIEDFDIEDGYLYFDYKFRIYRLDLSLESVTPELIIDDTNHAGISALAVINNTLYYQSFWGSLSKIMQVNLNNISDGSHEINPTEVFRGELVKKENKLIYLSRPASFSSITNFYQLDAEVSDIKISSDQAAYLDYNNLKFIRDALYFTSGTDIRKIDLNNTNPQSSIVYTVPKLDHGEDGDIIGFDIQDNVIFYSRMSTNKLFTLNLNTPNLEPTVIQVNDNLKADDAGYTELIVKNGFLYAKKIDEETIEVFKV